MPPRHQTDYPAWWPAGQEFGPATGMRSFGKQAVAAISLLRHRDKELPVSGQVPQRLVASVPRHKHAPGLQGLGGHFRAEHTQREQPLAQGILPLRTTSGVSANLQEPDVAVGRSRNNPRELKASSPKGRLDDLGERV
jgi:hypothetical protein